MKPQTKVRLAKQYMLKQKYQSTDLSDDIISHGLWETCALELRDDREIFTLKCIIPHHPDRKLNEQIKMPSIAIAVLCDEIEWIRKDITPEEYKK
jgi:hypothetical protein